MSRFFSWCTFLFSFFLSPLYPSLFYSRWSRFWPESSMCLFRRGRFLNGDYHYLPGVSFSPAGQIFETPYFTQYRNFEAPYFTKKKWPLVLVQNLVFCARLDSIVQCWFLLFDHQRFLEGELQPIIGSFKYLFVLPNCIYFACWFLLPSLGQVLKCLFMALFWPVHACSRVWLSGYCFADVRWTTIRAREVVDNVRVAKERHGLLYLRTVWLLGLELNPEDDLLVFS